MELSGRAHTRGFHVGGRRLVERWLCRRVDEQVRVEIAAGLHKATRRCHAFSCRWGDKCRSSPGCGGTRGLPECVTRGYKVTFILPRVLLNGRGKSGATARHVRHWQFTATQSTELVDARRAKARASDGCRGTGRTSDLVEDGCAPFLWKIPRCAGVPMSRIGRRIIDSWASISIKSARLGKRFCFGFGQLAERRASLVEQGSVQFASPTRELFARDPLVL